MGSRRLGALKIAVFAATLGNIELKFPTGVVYLGERGLHSICHLLNNTGELSYDVAKASYEGYRALHWTAFQSSPT